MSHIQIEYDGEYPNLCEGTLVVTIGVTRWEFPSYCLASNGGCFLSEDSDEPIERGPWTVE